MKRSRRNHAPAFKAKVARAALKGDRTLAELAQQFDVHPNKITQWKSQLLERALELFATPAERARSPIASSPSSMKTVDLNSGSTVKVERMDRTADTELPAPLPPNHHGDHPGFGGLGGLMAALSFTVGRQPGADLAVRLASVGVGDRVVDIGCGPGVAMRRAAAAGAASVIGVDPAAVMLRVGRVASVLRPRRAQVRFVRGAAEALPLEDA